VILPGLRRHVRKKLLNLGLFTSSTPPSLGKCDTWKEATRNMLQPLSHAEAREPWPPSFAGTYLVFRPTKPRCLTTSSARLAKLIDIPKAGRPVSTPDRYLSQGGWPIRPPSQDETRNRRNFERTMLQPRPSH